MSKILFAKEDILNLEKNQNFLSASECSITYTDEFNRIYSLKKILRIMKNITLFILIESLIRISKWQK